MEKYNFLILGLILLLCVCCATEKTSELQTFSPEGEGFSILLPGTPKSEMKTDNAAIGQIVTKSYTYEEGDMAYSIACIDYPTGALQQKSVDELMAGASNWAAGNVNGKVISETSISLGGYQGREFYITAGEYKTRSRVYLVKDRLYMIVIVAPEEKLDTPIVESVLESFNLTG